MNHNFINNKGSYKAKINNAISKVNERKKLLVRTKTNPNYIERK